VPHRLPRRPASRPRWPAGNNGGGRSVSTSVG
jgi:hypothetical protein